MFAWVILAILAVGDLNTAKQYLCINGSCHKWQLLTVAIDTQLPNLRKFMPRRFQTLNIKLNIGTVNISRYTVHSLQVIYPKKISKICHRNLDKSNNG